MARTLSFKTVSPDRIAIPETRQIELTDVESQLCTLLDECTQHLADQKGIVTSCRVAGGWVRDKLLGSESHDIDIALTDMMGYPFAVEFAEYVSEIKHIPVKSIATVKGNPGQSKHLETAKTTVLGIELDFVNLRDEAYADNSRIPTEVTFGTPLQDALRRDITINSLFYNVHTRSVEDHCGKGLDDLKNGIIRTPLPPRQTFLDDPLRVIRCIRFASRFGFDMVSELQESARDSEIQASLLLHGALAIVALAQKITRERVGEEIDKMMGGRNPLRSIQLIDSLSLFTTIFCIPEPTASTLSGPAASPSLAVAAAAILRTFLRPEARIFDHPALHPLLASAVTSPSVAARLNLACALTPYRGVTYVDHKKKERPAVEAAIRDGLKVGTKNHYLDGIPALFAAAELLKSPKLDSERFQTPSERVAIGMLLRDTSVHNPLVDSHWTTSVLFSLVQDLVFSYDASTDAFDVDSAAACIQIYNAFMTRVQELDLEKAVDAKHILDGREVVQVLGAAKHGQWTGRVLTDVMKWQLGHPDGSKEDCAEWLRTEHAEGRITTEDSKASIVVGKRGKSSRQETTAKKPKT
ncbi:hypothetical protein BV25DRAFT_1915513 [Artomyces pyxidatus]|uniref:Uncharacterized protein n=1 Tax=Artomyces pyxidatus TaxID=48021 RepID=A0ACB8T362_9AGAM|nr:hypothetical protein BV25DRAFT_1915513 [Artomyces pyxidatus]